MQDPAGNEDPPLPAQGEDRAGTIDVLKLIRDGELNEDLADDLMDAATERFHSGQAYPQMRVALGLSEPEYRAWVFGVPFELISHWRYSGWPPVCLRCGERIAHTGGWMAEAGPDKTWGLAHLPSCPGEE